MASEVAPCMPLQLFRRSTTRRPRLPEVVRHLSEDLATYVAAAGGCEEAPAAPTPTTPTQARAEAGVFESGRKHLQAIQQVFAETTETSERPSCHPLADASGSRGGYSGAAATPSGSAVSVSQKETRGSPALPEESRLLLAQFLELDLPARLVAALGLLDFEARKDVIGVFSAIIRLSPASVAAGWQVHEYVRSHPRFFDLLVDGCERAEVATHCGVILRSCARHPRLTEVFLARPEVPLRLLKYTRHKSFDISSDAFSSLTDFLLMHKELSAAFLEANFREFFTEYNVLLESGSDYVTQRQALKLLSEMLLNRTFMRVMLAYVGDDSYLQIHMNLLKENSRAIQSEAFHVFKIFVANPHKPPRIHQILYKNKEKLVRLLEALKPGRPDEKQFSEDKALVVQKLQDLAPPPPRTATTAAAATSPPVSAPTASDDAVALEDARQGEPATPPLGNVTERGLGIPSDSYS